MWATRVGNRLVAGTTSSLGTVQASLCSSCDLYLENYSFRQDALLGGGTHLLSSAERLD
jgi:hypothetical protein